MNQDDLKVNDNRKKSYKLLYLILLIIFIAVILRLITIMLFGYAGGENLDNRLAGVSHQNQTLMAPRGTIYDRQGEPIVQDASTYAMVAVLKDNWNEEHDKDQVEDKEKTALVLSNHINMSAKDILKRLNQEGSAQVEFGNAGQNLSITAKNAIEEENLPGIIFYQTPGRLYPYGTFASHLIGYTNLTEATKDQESPYYGSYLEGQMGIELIENSTLAGQNAKTDQSGKAEKQAPIPGDDVYLTLEASLQSYLEELATEVDNKYGPEDLTVNLVEAKTGRLLASTQRPTFEPVTLSGIENEWNHLLVGKEFEPGSTLKVITLAAAINEGVFNPTGQFQSGTMQVDGVTVPDHQRDWGVISQIDGLARSSNVLFVRLVGEMGYDKWYEYLERFGFLSSTESGFPGEASGSIQYTYAIEKANTTFGQGITVTPIQMLEAYTAIANDGQRLKVQTVDKRVNKQNQTDDDYEIKILNQPITAETARLTREYLTQVVENENGTGRNYAIDGVRIAAKTGTAQLVNSETGSYYEKGKYIYSVVGFAPYDNPEYIIYITLQDPEASDVPAGTMMEEIFVPLLTRALNG